MNRHRSARGQFIPAAPTLRGRSSLLFGDDSGLNFLNQIRRRATSLSPRDAARALSRHRPSAPRDMPRQAPPATEPLARSMQRRTPKPATQLPPVGAAPYGSNKNEHGAQQDVTDQAPERQASLPPPICRRVWCKARLTAEIIANSTSPKTCRSRLKATATGLRQVLPGRASRSSIWRSSHRQIIARFDSEPSPT